MTGGLQRRLVRRVRDGLAQLGTAVVATPATTTGFAYSITKRRSPPGVEAETSSPMPRPMRALAIGDSIESLPLLGSEPPWRQLSTRASDLSRGLGLGRSCPVGCWLVAACWSRT
jgi:hypothetical protein